LIYCFSVFFGEREREREEREKEGDWQEIKSTPLKRFPFGVASRTHRTMRIACLWCCTLFFFLFFSFFFSGEPNLPQSKVQKLLQLLIDSRSK
jgi:hypothetical protein